MGDAPVARYWCHMCSQLVNPVMEVEIKCPFCESGFVEEMDSFREQDNDNDLGSDRALSLWAPILLGMMGGTRRRRFRREEDGDEEAQQGGSEQERELESFLRRRRRHSAAISAALFNLLQSLRASGIASEMENSESDRERDPVILVNPFNQAIILQGLFDTNQNENQGQNAPSSLGDYFLGSSLDLLLQHLAENDPNRYGTPPAQKEAVEAMPTVKITENLQCSVCLDDLEIGTEAKEMPCKHKFHSGCILPWLKLHSSCPICRFRIPADESKLASDGSGNSENRGENSSGVGPRGGEGSEEGGNGNGRRFWVPIPWPFNGLFSMSGSQNDGNSSSQSSSSASAGNASHTDDN
ncbi:PREDICTED: E3 ubiquitin-protein ligase RING1-like [Nelumbo nucifera]|uniref:RING-type E3 ubiquitin transferase n=1 Tax=Nelumbo nucifera TaxID=4432 RepID=A0A1U7ZVL8_NELNU|nr:PREDICTED: E3 ubiquitin-protein ligase RING1-like [Nelumbo nucifera]XP_010257724.1 PREDICTED: E3 ubiquitin-protein ligase RING1-like [Nelumbo nucifera]